MERNDDLKRLIDEGVQRYAGAEPPLGLESRVIAALQAKQRQRRWWTRPWLIAIPAAAILAMVIGLSLEKRTEPQPSAPQKASTGPLVSEPPPQTQPQVAVRTPAPHVARPAAVQVSAQAPKLERFPAPEPASQQETLLARLVHVRMPPEAAAAAEPEAPQDVVVSQISIRPIEIQPLPDPNPQGE